MERGRQTFFFPVVAVNGIRPTPLFNIISAPTNCSLLLLTYRSIFLKLELGDSRSPLGEVGS